MVDRFLRDPRLTEYLSAGMDEHLSKADLALLNHLDLVETDFDNALAEFSDPGIDLVLAEIIRIDSLRYRAELYFLPRERIVDDYMVALWVGSPDSEVAEGLSGSRNLPFDFRPVPPSSAWKSGRVALAYRYFDFADEISAVSVGLYRSADGRVKYLDVTDSDGSVAELPLSSILAP